MLSTNAHMCCSSCSIGGASDNAFMSQSHNTTSLHNNVTISRGILCSFSPSSMPRYLPSRVTAAERSQLAQANIHSHPSAIIINRKVSLDSLSGTCIRALKHKFTICTSYDVLANTSTYTKTPLVNSDQIGNTCATVLPPQP